MGSAFLGPAYDETLRSVFATGEMANLLQPEGLAGLFGTGLFKTEPLRDLIARHVDGSMLAAIAREQATNPRAIGHHHVILPGTDYGIVSRAGRA